VILQTTNRTQAKGSTVRLVAPRALEMAYEREPPLSEAELLEVEEYLLECGYVAPTNIGLRWATYTITPAGFSWLEGGLPSPTDRLREIAKRPGKEVAFESAVKTDLEEERHRMEELESELEQMRQNLPVYTETPAVESERAESQLAGDTFHTASERLPWWRRMFWAVRLGPDELRRGYSRLFSKDAFNSTVSKGHEVLYLRGYCQRA
jgi:hypothetical protein